MPWCSPPPPSFCCTWACRVCFKITTVVSDASSFIPSLSRSFSLSLPPFLSLDYNSVFCYPSTGVHVCLRLCAHARVSCVWVYVCPFFLCVCHCVCMYVCVCDCACLVCAFASVLLSVPAVKYFPSSLTSSPICSSALQSAGTGCYSSGFASTIKENGPHLGLH